MKPADSPNLERKLSETQALIRRTYGTGAFDAYRGWERRKVVGVLIKGSGRKVFIYSDGTRA